jgi:hypothetical protein
MSGLTVFLSRSLGLFMILLVVGLWVRGTAAIEASVNDGPVLLSYAIISLAMGVAMVVGHNVWSAGALPLVVVLWSKAYYNTGMANGRIGVGSGFV